MHRKVRESSSCDQRLLDWLQEYAICRDGINCERVVVGFGSLPLYLSTHNVINTHIDPQLVLASRLGRGLLVCWCHKSQTRENRSDKDNSSVAYHCYK